MDAARPPSSEMLTAIGSTSGVPGLVDAGRLTRWSIGTLLLAAASLKAHALFGRPVVAPSWLAHPALQLFAIEFEGVVGIGMLAGIFRRILWSLAVCGFATFSVITAYLVAIGAPSCGCFGAISPPPAYTLALDLIVVFVLLYFRRDMVGLSENPQNTLRILPQWLGVSAALALMAASSYVMVFISKQDGGLQEYGEAHHLVVLEPSKWIGRRFPLIDYINVGVELERGEWIVLLYRYDCDHCISAVPQYERAAQRTIRSPDASARLALIEMPPFAPAGRELVDHKSPSLIGRLTEAKEWFAETPVMLRLNNGVVASASEGRQAETPSVEAFTVKRG